MKAADTLVPVLLVPVLLSILQVDWSTCLLEERYLSASRCWKYDQKHWDESQLHEGGGASRYAAYMQYCLKCISVVEMLRTIVLATNDLG